MKFPSAPTVSRPKCEPSLWETVALLDKAAASVGCIQVKYATPSNNDAQLETYDGAGPLSVQMFGGTQLTRLCMHYPDGRIGVSFEFPENEKWKATYLKTKGKTAALGVQVTITFKENSICGMERLVLTMPREEKDNKEQGPGFALAKALVGAGAMATAAAEWREFTEKAKEFIRMVSRQAADVALERSRMDAINRLDAALALARKQNGPKIKAKPTLKSPPPPPPNASPTKAVRFASPVAKFQSPVGSVGSLMSIDECWSPEAHTF